MFRKFVIAVLTAVATILQTAADAIAATPPPAADTPRLRVVASGRLCLRLLIMSPPRVRPAPGQRAPVAPSWLTRCRQQKAHTERSGLESCGRLADSVYWQIMDLLPA